MPVAVDGRHDICAIPRKTGSLCFVTFKSVSLGHPLIVAFFLCTLILWWRAFRVLYCWWWWWWCSQNPDNKVAEDMFMKIAKAYEALTDATVRTKHAVMMRDPSFDPLTDRPPILTLAPLYQKRRLRVQKYRTRIIQSMTLWPVI